MRDSDGLTPKQRRFVVDYHLTGNATQAALNSYDTKPSVAHAVGAENLRKPAIKEALQALVEREKAITDAITDGKILTEAQRKIRLSEIALEDNEGKFGFQRDPCVRAIDVLNKMDKLYAEGSSQAAINVVFVVGRGYRESPQVKQIEAKDVQ